MIPLINLLTLSISETWENNYKVVAYNIDKHQFHALKIHESKFFNPDGSNAWDLFGVTSVEGLKPTSGEFMDPIGLPRVVNYYNKKEMIDFFNRKQMPANRFFSGRFDYGIIKADSITKIHLPIIHEKLSQKIDFFSGSYKYPNVLNKDFKWLQYWNQLPKDEYEEKILQWTNYFKENNNEIFLVLHYYSRYQYRWIVGFHCL